MGVAPLLDSHGAIHRFGPDNHVLVSATGQASGIGYGCTPMFCNAGGGPGVPAAMAADMGGGEGGGEGGDQACPDGAACLPFGDGGRGICVRDCGDAVCVQPIVCSNDGYRSHIGWVRSPRRQEGGGGGGGDDVTPPEVTAPHELLVVEQQNPDGAMVWLEEPLVRDDQDPDPAVFVDIPALRVVRVPIDEIGGLPFPAGDTAVEYIAVDEAGNEASDIMIVRVQDTTPPEFVDPPARVVVEATSWTGTVVDLEEPEVHDAGDADVTVESDAPARYPLGETAVTFTATDDAGNQAQVVVVVEVVDTTPPQITLGVPGGRLEAEQTDLDGSEVDLPDPVVVDNGTAPDRIVVASDAPEVFPLGETVVTYTATDESGNQAQVELTVVVADHQIPRVEVVSAPEAYTNRNAVAVVFRVTDNCDAAPVVSVAPQPAALDHEGDLWTATFTEEGLYDVTITAEDVSGNTARTSNVLFGIDRTPPRLTARQIPNPAAMDRPVDWPVFFKGELFVASFRATDGVGDEASGLAEVEVALVRRDPESGEALQSWDLLDETFDTAGLPERGPLTRKNLACTNGDVCADGLLTLEELTLGQYYLDARVADTAGNEVRSSIPFNLANLLLAIEDASDWVRGALAGDPGDAQAPLVESRDLLGDPEDGEDFGAHYAWSNQLLGNTMLYLQDVTKQLKRADDAGTDTDSVQNYLARASVAETRLLWKAVNGLVAPHGDSAKAKEHLDAAQAALDNGDYLLMYLELMHTLFFTQNYDEPLFIHTDLIEGQAKELMDRLAELLGDYLEIQGINGRACVSDALDHIEEARTLYGDHDNYNLRTINLMLELNHASDVLHSCIPEWVWVRYWQWGLVQVVKSYVQRGRMAASAEVGCGYDPDQPDCWAQHPLLGEAACRYQEGLGLFEERQVDEALDVYILARCMMVELYNYAFAADAIDFPPECDEYVTYTCYDPNRGQD